MKKGIIVLLVAVLAAGFAFAGLSGSAEVDFKFDLQNKAYGFVNDTAPEFTFDIAADTADVAGEGKIYASLKASAKLLIAPAYDPYVPTDSKYSIYIDPVGKTHGIGLLLKVSEAKINGENWYVSILGVDSAADYAKAAQKTDTKKVYDAFGTYYKNTTQPYSYSASYKKAPGIAVNYDGWKASFGFYAEDSVGIDYSATFETKAIEVEGFSVQAAAEISQKETGSSTQKMSVGGSVKTGYAADKASVKVAADMGYINEKFNADVRLDAAYDFVTADAYFCTVGEYLEAEVKTDLKNFDVPVALTIYGQSLMTKNAQVFGAKATYNANENITVKLDANYSLAKKLGTSASVAYEDDDLSASFGATYKTTIGTDNSSQLYFTASAESTAIISGATIGISYTDPTKVSNLNLLKGQATAQNLGVVTTYCTIEF